MPKNVNWSRTVKDRMLATCDSINKGVEGSLMHKFEVVGAAISKGGAVAWAVQLLPNDAEYSRTYR